MLKENKEKVLMLGFLFWIFCGCLFLYSPIHVQADETIANKELDTNDFVLSASIDKRKVRDGTPDFDADDAPGHDSSDHNGIVRTKDTVTIPLKLTINPKKDIIKNITIRTTVKIQNDGLEGLKDVYTTETNIKQTSTAVYMDLPFVVPFYSHNFDLNPEVDVEVIKVNGENVESQKVIFDDFFHLKTSAKANIAYQFCPVNMFDPSFIHDGDVRMKDFETLFMTGIRFFSNLNTKGSTFPKNIRMEIKTDGSVNYDLDKYQDFNFDNKNSPVHGFDVHSFYSASGGTKYGLLSAKSNTEAIKRGSRYLVGSDTSSYDSFFLSNYNSLDRDYCGYELRVIPTNDNSFVFELSNLHVNPDLSNSYYTGSNTKLADIGFIEYSDKDFSLGGRDNVNKLNNTEFYRFISHLQLPDDVSFYRAYNDTAYNLEQIRTLQRRNFDSTGNLSGRGYWDANQDIYWKDFIQNRLTGRANFYWDFSFGNQIYKGGFDLLLKFNPDSFKKNVGHVLNELHFYNNKRIRYGIAKDSNNEFNHFIHKEKDDYIWYDNYYDDKEHGRTSAILYEVTEPNFLMHRTDGYDLHLSEPVNYDGNRFGTTNEKNTYNLGQGIMYLYSDKDRKNKPIVYGSPNQEGRFNNPWILDDQLNTLKPQSARDSLSTFDTVNVRPMNLSVDANIGVVNENYINKDGVYYDHDNIMDGNQYAKRTNNDVAHLSIGDYIYTPIAFGVTYPKMYGLDGKNNVLTLQVTVPKGLSYVENSLHSVDDATKPVRTFFDKPCKYTISKRTKLEDGSEEFLFDIPIDQGNFLSNATINDIVYQGSMAILGMKFKVTPAFFDGQGSFVTKNFKLRAFLKNTGDRNEASISGNRLYMLSVLEEVGSKSQKRNQPFSIDINPFTTNEREDNIRGAFHVPSNNDENGSRFAGELNLKNIELNANKTINVYVNKKRLDVSNVLGIDVNRDGWLKYTTGMDLTGIQSVYYEVPGTSTVSDNLHLKLNFETKGNRTGDTYVHTSYVNSDNAYRISPEASKVSYVVDDVPPLKVDFSKIQIRTKPKEDGLDVDVYTDKTLIDDSGKEVSFKVELWDNTTKQKVTEKDFTGDSLPGKISFKVPSNLLEQDGQQHNYEVRLVGLEGSDAKINTDGYTSSKKIVRLDDLKDHLKDDTYIYRPVIMTERYKGKDINRYYEEIKVPVGKPYHNKTGYSINLKPFAMSYQNDLQEFKSVDGLELKLLAEKGLVEKANIRSQGLLSKYAEVNVENINRNLTDNHITFDIDLPEVVAHYNDGKIQLAKDVKDRNDYYKGGRNLYIPIWTNLKNYELVYDLSDQKIGVNQVSVMLTKHVDVYAYMYNPAESTSVINDELMLKPNMKE